MVMNDFKSDLKGLTRASGMTHQNIADAIGAKQPQISAIFGGKIIPERFVKACEAMGYDVKVVYVKRAAEVDK